MLTLGIETAGDQGSVGLLREDQPLSEIVFSAALKQGEKLLPALEETLQLAEVHRRDLELISISLGPGSFTGLRIGLALGKGLARALEIPMVGVSAMEEYARMAGFWKGPVWVILPDRRDWVYCAVYQQDREIHPVHTTTLEALMKGLRDSEALLIGPGAEQHRAELQTKCPQAVVAPVQLNRPSALQVARLGFQKYLKSRHDELYELEPLYLQAPPAEIVTQQSS